MGKTYHRRKEKEKGKEVSRYGRWSAAENSPTLRMDPVGEAYGESNWALKTNERSIVKQMPLLSEFSSYSEWGKKLEDGKRHFTIIP